MDRAARAAGERHEIHRAARSKSAHSVSDLLRRNLTKAHQVSVQEIRGIEGRVHFSASVKRFSFNSGRAVCTFPEMSANTLRNQVIRATLTRLLKDERIAVGAQPNQVQMLRSDIRRATAGMEGVSSLRVQPEHFRRIQLGRNDGAYEVPLAVCNLLHRCEIPGEERGYYVIAALLRDEIEFSRLFERFVRNFLRYTLTEATVHSETLWWPEEYQSGLVPRMSTDVTVEWRHPVARRIVDPRPKDHRHTLASRVDRV